MSRADTALVFWKHYAYGYEARLTPYGKAFARARMVQGVPGVHYELIWIYGPSQWRPMRVFNVMTIERMVERWVACHRDSLVRKMPPDPMKPPANLPIVDPSPTPDPYAVRGCPDCGRNWGYCARTLPRAERKSGARGWPCTRRAA
ncbi:hypothetical protein [Luteibacter sp.]|jgi:hypothetical protein|uniref:hypothetical protein n=1 Tax=Luteibacter sp. TaxID=1886636 RepID=UPI002F40B28B